jgi:Tol biopolymer transport system component
LRSPVGNQRPHAPVAQLDRASASGAEGRAFESRRAYGGSRGGPAAPLPLRSLTLLVGLLVFAAAGAGAQYFGQNKVPWPAGRWHVIETDHFRIHYEEGEGDFAREATRVAERGYARLSRVFAHELKDPIPVILYASQSEFRETRAVSGLIGEETGGVTEFYKRRVIVPSTGSLAELDHVLVHEMTHAFEIDILRESRAGRATEALSWTPPLWVMEGLAEYLSVPGVDANTEMWLRDAVLTGMLPSLQQLEGVGDIRVYRFGESAIAQVAAQFGDGTLGPWLRAMARRRSLGSATRDVLGMSLEKLSDDWQESLRRRYLPDVARGTDPGDVAHRLTDHRRSLADFYVAPTLSPDGLRVAYIADETPYADLYVASAIDGRHRRRLIGGERRETFESLRYARTSIDWSPDGATLALVARTGDRDRLTLLDVESRRVLRSFDFGFDEMLSPTFSPDGRALAFVGLRGGGSRLYRVTVAGDSLRALCDLPWGVFQPAFSPDGRRIAFVTDAGRSTFWSDSTDASWEIAILDLRSGRVERVLPAAGKNIDPQWLPDGRHLLYLSDRTGVTNLYARDLETGRDYALTNLRTGISGLTPTSAALSVAADGKRAVFTVFADLGWDLYEMESPLAGLDSAMVWTTPPPWVAPPVPDPPDSLLAAAQPDSSDTTRAAPDIDLATAIRDAAALPETLSVREVPYRPRLSLDYVQAGGLYATQYGAVAQGLIGFSDMLGDRQVFVGLDVSGSFSEGDYLLGVTNQRHRGAWTAAVYQYLAGYGLGVTPGFPAVYQKRLFRGASLGYTYPLSHFRRIEVFVDGIWERRFDWSCVGEPQSQLWICGWADEHHDLFYATPQVAWVFDSALFGPTGPLSGRRARISSGVDIGDRHTRNFQIDLRSYMNLRKRYAIAWRGVMFGQWGPDREPVAFGGPYSIHGYANRPLVGTSIAFMNVEFRFPFIDELTIAWPARLHFYGFRGAAFFDMGGAWDDAAHFRPVRVTGGNFRLEDLKASVGARASINLGIAVLGWDLSRRTDLARWRGPWQGEVSLGWEF